MGKWMPVPGILDRKLSFFTAKKYGYLIGIRYFDKKCSSCSNSKNIHFHHVNEDKWDNRLENIMPLCSSCHRIWHEEHDEKLLDSHKRQGEKIRRLFKSGRMISWNTGLTIADKKLAAVGRKISASKRKNPYVIGERHKQILFETGHTIEANKKRSEKMKLVWQERKGGIACGSVLYRCNS
jgi:hypothetical protein